jgi:diguanylate cyclase (GGDEF)-like protein
MGTGTLDQDTGLRDPLTGLPTRPLLAEHLALALARAERADRHVAVLHVGLDAFHLVNDSLGRAAGDAVLREAATRLREAVDATRTVARPHGDEFCVLVADLGSDADDAAQAVAGHVLDTLREPFAVDGREFELAASAGVSVFPRDGRDERTLLKHAEAAMYEAKERRRGGLVFYGGGTSEALERLLLTSRLRRALERDEFVLHFQPMYRLPAGDLTAVEALIRWQDPHRGLVPPDRFIPAAEHTGFIRPVGEWVLEAVCRQSATWRQAGLRTPVSFNVSLGQFREPGFPDAVEAAMRAHGVDPGDLIVEITETVAMRDPECVEPVLDELRALGVRIAIDDFGVGYSSLARLKEMPVDILKLDAQFLPQEPGDVRAATLTRAALELVGALGMSAVAEGVQTVEQRQLLTDAHCPVMQGFLLSEPLPAEAMTELLRSTR